MFWRRKFKRQKIKGCTIKYFTDDWEGSCKVIDISDGGMKVDFDSIPDKNSELRVVLPNNSIKRAKIVWYFEKIAPEIGATVGLQFY